MLEDGIKQHDYRTDSSRSYDTYTFTSKQVISALKYLFPGEDLTQPHTVYLHDVFVKKKRATTSSPWIYDYGKTTYDGKEYHTLDQFLTMYPYYAGNNAKREEMSPYYNIPITIALKGVNVEVICVDTNGNVLKNLGTKKVAMGDEFVHNVANTTLTVKNKKYQYEKYDFNGESGAGKKITVDEVLKDGKLKLIYKTENEPPKIDKGNDTETDSMIGYPNGPTSSTTIKADYRGSELFDSLKGVPTTESLYVNAFANKYMADYRFKKMSGSKTYNITVSRNYVFVNTEDYEDEEGKKQYRTVRSYDSVSRNYSIKRDYSYWVVDGFNVYTPKEVEVRNYSLPGERITLNAVGLIAPSVVIQKPSKYIVEPVYSNISLPTRTIYESYSTPYENWKSTAESAIGEITCMNDYLSFNGNVYMSSTPQKKSTPNPKSIPVLGDLVSNNIFYQAGLLIDYNKDNGIHKSEGEVTYVPSYTYGSKNKDLEGDYAINSINDVTIHTPVICDASIKGSEAFNQMITPDRTRVSLVLDQYFAANISTFGNHLNIPGYGNNNYFKYTYSKEVKFPFDVYAGSKFVPRNTWYEIPNETMFYLPSWVNEGNYIVNFRSLALNSEGRVDGQVYANTNRSKYVATDSINVQVSGRLYGFSVYDISDYPTWQSIFRKPNSISLSNTLYSVGLRNRNGVLVKDNSLYTLPIMEGSHPTNKTLTVGSGYIFRYSMYTIGNMYDTNDAISIKPTFYFVSKDGSKKQEVDVYYTETFNGKSNKLVKVGSELDGLNKKKMSLGNTYTSVPNSELQTTANLLNTTVKELKSIEVDAYTFNNIYLNEKLRTFVGTGNNVPSSVDKNMAIKSVQKWYGEYYLPSDIHIVKKGYDVQSQAEKKGINYKESFWLNGEEGYLLINFNIKTVNNDREYLTYNGNAAGDMCNMWTKEGFTYSKKIGRITHILTEGDIFMYNISNSSRKDFNSGGTH